MRRREFIAAARRRGGGVAACARAQQPAMPVIGFLARPPRRHARTWSVRSGRAWASRFRRGPERRRRVSLGGRSARSAAGWRPIWSAARWLSSPRAARRPPSRRRRPTIPIVFLTGYDPVRTGFVASLSRPGGNVTGVVFTVTDLMAKQLGLLHELVPKAAVIAVLLDPNQLESDIEMREAEAAGRAIGRQILIVESLQ